MICLLGSKWRWEVVSCIYKSVAQEEDEVRDTYFRVISQSIFLSQGNEGENSWRRGLRPELLDPIMFQECREKYAPAKEIEEDRPVR